MQFDGKIKIAIQKSGRLADESISLLRRMGLRFEAYRDRLFTTCRDMPVDVIFLRDDDIPEYVADGVADAGIVGSNVLNERMADVDRLLPLDFGFCSLCLAVPERGECRSVGELNGKRIATSHPETLGRYLRERKIEAQIVTLSGCVEIAPVLRVADAICDLVSTGSALRTHGLTVLETVSQCQAEFFSRRDPPSETRRFLERLLLRARAVQEARKYRYVMFNSPADAVEAIKRILPGRKSPTIIPLADPGFVAIHAMVLEETFWDVIERLRECEATDILVTPVEKFMP